MLNSSFLIEVAAFKSRLCLILGETHLHELLNFGVVGAFKSVVLYPLFSSILVQFSIRLVHVGNLGILRIIWIPKTKSKLTTSTGAYNLKLTRLRRAHKGLQRNKGRADGQSWSPFVFKNVQTDGSSLRRNVGMPHFRVKFHLNFWLSPISILFANLQLSELKISAWLP